MELQSKEYIGVYIKRARDAQKEFEKLSQEKVDLAVKTIAKVVYDNAKYLAEIAVEETGMGNVEDKTVKNQMKAKVIYNNLKDKKSRGILDNNKETGIMRVAKPIGVVGAITPTTNPIVTPMSNAMFALKCGNAIIITPHHKAKGCSTKTVDMINEKLEELGFPKYLIQIIDKQSRENTRELISSVDVVVATGGMSMVSAAYSSGKPALGVGAGNVQCIVDKDVDFEDAISKVVTGRAFDNGIICSGEQSVICPKENLEEIKKAFAKFGGFVISDSKQEEAVTNVLFNEGKMNKDIVGQDVKLVANQSKITIPEGTKILVVEASHRKGLLGKEKMCPVLALYTYENFDQAIEIANENLDMEGKGHSVSLHSYNQEHIEKVATSISVSRFVLNQVCASSAGGSFYNGLAPTNTLGCGSWGNNSISENLDFKHLMNVSQVASFMKDNKVPSDEELWN